jgi:glycosyltransferase involved in cell wall biosynthesis
MTSILQKVKKMHILHVISTVDPRTGGPIEGVIQQATHRPEESFVTEIVCLDNPTESFVKACPILVHALGTRSVSFRKKWDYLPWVHYGYTSKMVPWLKANINNYDIVVVNGIWTYAAMACRRALVGGGVPYVVFTHGMLDPWFKVGRKIKTFIKQISWLCCEGPLLNNANAVLFTTEEERVLARNAFWPYRVKERTVGYGTADIMEGRPTELAAFQSRLPELGTRRYLLFLSRIHVKKGCDLLIEAYAMIAAAYPDVDLVIAGPDQTGWCKKLKALSKKCEVEKRIHWPGMLSGDAKRGAYQGAMAFVLPSHQENFGIVVAEAMSAAKPVLITDKVNIWREVSACGGGLVEPDTKEGVFRLLDDFLSMSDDEKAAMGLRARAGFLDKFEIRKVVRSLSAHYCEIANFTVLKT